MSRQAPPLYPWQRTILRLIVAQPGLTTGEIGDRYAPHAPRYVRTRVALHELRILAARNLVQRHRHTWSPSLMAVVALGGSR